MDDFDLDRYLRASKKVDLTGVSWEAIRDHPLPVAEARCLAYMMDIESHTVIFLRDLLATRAAFDPEVTAFLSCWVYEELWHGEAFSRFLGEAGYHLAPDGERVWGDAPYPTRNARNTWIRRRVGAKGYMSHVATLAAAAVFKDFVALLVELLQRIINDERRHFAFYRSQARMRLARSRQARSVTRWAVEHLWAPVGTGVRPQEETDFVIAWLFGDHDGRAAAEEIDLSMAELPGFAATRVARDALSETLRRIEAGRRIPGWYADRPWNGQRSSWRPAPPPSRPRSWLPRERPLSTTEDRAMAPSSARSPKA